jgi:hypothetical protein
MTILNVQHKKNPAIWLDFISYANRLFNQGQPDIWSNPVTFLSVYGQGQSLLHSDVISIPVLPFYTNWLKNNPDEITALKGKKLKFIFKKMISYGTPKHTIQEVLKGISHLYFQKQPIVLIIPSPQLWLLEAAKLTDSESAAIDENLVDAASIYLADLLRNFSDAGLSGIVIDEAVESLLPSDAVEQYLQPVINVAHHYQWEIGYWKKSSRIKQSFADFILEPDNQKILGKSALVLKRSWWAETSDSVVFGDAPLIFAEIPVDAVPERVLQKAEELRAAAKSR